jgi:adenylosuccinate synthase
MNKYNTMVIVGAQWGDEGKGKMTDVFAQTSDVVARFAGGDNAGHVINFNGKKYKVTIVPSGIFNPKTINVIGNGCVVNLENLVSEFEAIKNSGEKIGKLLISDRAHLIFPYHSEIDAAQEDARGEFKIGTTKKGIGPAYQDRVSRMGLRVGDVALPNFKEKLKANVAYQNKFLKAMFNKEPIDFETVYKNTMAAYEKIKSQVIDCGLFLESAIKEGKNVLFEGAQGALLDIDHGTYPFVTSSNCSANNVSLGTGISQRWITNIVGVVKAYCTRVGTGAFPTELKNEIGDQIREIGHEYGSNTGRPRRIGWLDLVALKYAIRISDLDEIFITLLDVLTGFDTLKVCTHYTLNGKELTSVPATNEEYEKCVPVYMDLPGWKEDITQVKSLHELPQNAKNYLEMISKICEVPIAGFSVGPDRKQTVLYENKFNK